MSKDVEILLDELLDIMMNLKSDTFHDDLKNKIIPLVKKLDKIRLKDD